MQQPVPSTRWKTLVATQCQNHKLNLMFLLKGNNCISSKNSRNTTFPSFFEKHLITKQHFEMFHQIVIIQITSHLTISQNFCKNRLIRSSSIGQAQIMCDANLDKEIREIFCFVCTLVILALPLTVSQSRFKQKVLTKTDYRSIKAYTPQV